MILSIGSCKYWGGASLEAQLVKNLPAMQETWVRFLGWEDPLEKEMAIHSGTATAAKSLQSCPTLSDPVDCSPPPGSSVHEIFQGRVLKWVAISFSNA